MRRITRQTRAIAKTAITAPCGAADRLDTRASGDLGAPSLAMPYSSQRAGYCRGMVAIGERIFDRLTRAWPCSPWPRPGPAPPGRFVSNPLSSDRASRLAKAAYLGSIVTGDLRDAPRLLEAARQADPEHGGSLAAAVASTHHLLNGDGDVDTAHRLMVGAIESLADSGDAHNKVLIEGLYTLLLVCFFGGRPELWKPFDAAIGGLRPRLPELLAILSRTFSDPVRLALPTLSRLDAVIAGLSQETTPARIVRTGIAAAYLDRLADCRAPLWQVVRAGPRH